jgi:endo-1,4-beta-D-glucanase Y
VKRRLPIIGAVILVLGVVAAFAVLRSGSDGGGNPEGDPVASDNEQAVAASEEFLKRYVDPDGRVVRRDQGSDTVSEGQAYAMLVAVAIEDRATFDRVWGWTRDNLQRPDGLLSFLWRDGHVADPQSAADADLDAARALLLAASRFGDETYRREALRIAEGIARKQTARSDGERVLLAGPWADYEDRLVVNPSYFAPRSYSLLAQATNDGIWQDLESSSRRIAAELVADGTRLPPNWAVIRGDMEIRASGPPSNEGEAPKYGFDAARLPLRYAESCDSRDRAIAADVWRVLSARGVDQLSTRHDLDGERDEEGVHPVGLVGAAGGAQAAGDREMTRELLRRAEELDDEFPTYYGSALVALGRLMLTTDRLGTCEPADQG